MTNEKLKIALVEDHLEFRESMAALINSSNQYSCQTFQNPLDFISFIAKTKYCPSVILMDINLPDMDGIECTKLVKQTFPDTLIMMCTVHEDDDKIFKALKAGASGYLLKRAAIEEIFAAIEDLLSGGSPMSSVIARKVVASFARRDIMFNNEFNLSMREKEILELLAQGLRLKEIADKCFITINTVRTHIRHIYEKLQVQSRIEALNKTKHNFL